MIVVITCFIVWAYIISVLQRAKLPFFKFIVGSVGMFIFLMVLVQPVATVPLARIVAVATGFFGDVTKMYQAYPQYALVFIQSGDSAISMYIDYECSGIIEIFAYISLLWFFPLYSIFEKTTLTIAGTAWIFLANVLRLFVICLMVFLFGDSIYYFAHAIFGRLIFYALSVTMYFYVFTKSQIIRQKVGKFSYGDNTR